MSAFQFPANPSDGDIVVRGDLQAFYNAATNTWRVSQLDQVAGIPGPPGPAGPPGPTGEGITISGVVDTETDLPLPNQHQYEFWFVDDVNEVFISNGNEWINAGGPIRGPQGEKGEDGANGTNGQNGRGWYDTDIDTSDDQYKIQFLSNDGLGFTTANLKGPQGEPGQDGQDGQDGKDFDGQIPLATTSSTGVVQIGNGIDVDTAGVISVDIDEVEVDRDTNNNYSLSFVPSYFNEVDNKTSSTVSYSYNSLPSVQTGTMEVPARANGAIVYFFAGSNVANNFNAPSGYGLNWTIFARLTSTLTFSGLKFVSTANQLAIPMTHNYSIGGEKRRGSESPAFKVGQVTFPFGTISTNVNVTTTLNGFQRATVRYGRCRVILVPYRDTEDVEGWNAMTPEERVAVYDSSEPMPDSDPFQPYPPDTEEDIKDQQAAEIGWQMSQELNLIDIALNGQYSSASAERNRLLETRQNILDLQLLSASAEDVQLALTNYGSAVSDLTEFNFLFNQ